MAAAAGLSRPIGARVTAVTPESPAAKARLQPGDIVLQFGGVLIEDDNHLVNLVNLTEIGKKVPVTIYRDRKPITIQVAVGDKSEF
jgi:serine protease Do